ncbi:glycoside hydrolase family 18 protein [Gilvimarinus sp. SDUM040013]|uniref:chitinase n=1 Tax=Gilvimarinus gilvus TaxID=3058038 RepID=A0ABU4RY60_9GAMM|nr:glycoside hydrolase family 18 protein [Gilvimarinus sp. SDUM040013]MDO3387362.1 glycoside hydrolase family 18 protein [Gilvimarinus sp. SDUM040013]MDX6849839.1 glycoside hydrolase family 18 protein [Gilvimarinus sp. SDUM040013]
MIKNIFLLLTCLAIFTGVSVAAAPDNEDKSQADKVIIGYVFSPDKPLDPATIAAEKLTHVNYAFSNLVDHKIVNGFEFDDQNYRRLNDLKKRNSSLKILSSVGGWTWSGGFSDMAATEESRQIFINSAVEFVRRHQLDGIDIDWEYPGLPGAGNKHRADDGTNFALVLKGLRAAFDSLEEELGRPLMLTIATGGFPDFLAKSDIGEWQKYLDYINIMAYDFNFPRAGGTTGHHTALYSRAEDDSGQSADAAVRNHNAAGVPLHKLVVGVAFYGRTWVNVNSQEAGLNQPGDAGEPSFGSARYNNLVASVIGKGTYQRHWDDIAKAPWLWSAQEKTFVSYDDPESIAAKVKYIQERGLGGVMFWQYTSDHNNQLLDAINNALER